MIAKHLPTLWAAALNDRDRDAYVSDWTLSSIWGDDPDAEIPPDRIERLGRIWDLAHMTINEIRMEAGLTQVALAARFAAPKRTVEDWCRGVRTPPDYVRLMACECLELL